MLPLITRLPWAPKSPQDILSEWVNELMDEPTKVKLIR